MGGLQHFEHRLEQMISGAFARAFRSAVQPVEIAAALQRECDNNAQILSRDRRLVPNDFHVELSQHRPRPAGAVRQRARRASSPRQLREHADEQSYVFPGPVTIAFDAADDLTTGRFRIRSRGAGQGHQPTPPHTQVRPGPGLPRGQRHPPPAASRPAWSSAAAPRPTCASTTPASAAGTSSSGSTARRRAGGDRARASTTSARPTACWSTATGSRRPPLHDGSAVRIGNTTMTVGPGASRRPDDV